MGQDERNTDACYSRVWVMRQEGAHDISEGAFRDRRYDYVASRWVQ